MPPAKPHAPLAVVLLLLIACSGGRAAEPSAGLPRYGAWHVSRIGGGGWIQRVVFTSDPRRLYAWVDVGGCWRSDDGGGSWRNLLGALPAQDGINEVRGVLVAPGDPDDILVACGNRGLPPCGIYRSRDGGGTFTRTLVARFAGNAEGRWDGVVLNRQPSRPQRVLAATIGDGFFASDDGGSTWSGPIAGTAGIGCTDLQPDARDPARWRACAQPLPGDGPIPALGGGLWRSGDAGATWTRLADDAPSEIAQASSGGRLVGLFRDGAALRASDDDGASWIAATDGVPSSEVNLLGDPVPTRFLAIAATPGSIVAISDFGRVFALADGATRWAETPRRAVDYGGWTIARRADIPGMFASFASGLSIDPSDPAHWFLADSFAIYETRDRGASWATAMRGLEATVIHALCQDPDDPGRVHLGMGDDGGFRSEDGGASFAIGDVCSNVKDIAVSRALARRVYATGTASWEWRSNQVFVSVDAGATWGRSPMLGLPDLRSASCNGVAVAPDDAYRCLLGVSGPVADGRGGPYLSVDGGRSWRWLGRGLPAGAAFFPDSIWIPGRQVALGADGFAACVGERALFVLAPDGGWQRVAGVGDVGCVVADPFAARVCVAVGESGVWRVVDGVAARVSATPSGQATFDQARRGRLAVARRDGVAWSDDDGATWHDAPAGLPLRSALEPLAFAGDRLVVGTGGCGVYWLALTAAAESDVAARPVAPAPARAAAGSPTLAKPAFVRGADGAPDGWQRAGSEQARLEFPAAGGLRVLLPSEGELRLSQPLGVAADPFRIASGLTTTDATEAYVAIQVFDAAWRQIAWIPVAGAKAVRPGPAVRRTPALMLPPDAAAAQLVITVKGHGSADVADLELTPAPPLFP